MVSLSLDLRSALRGLARDRAFTLFSVLALALGLGLNGSLLVLSRAFLLRSAPVAAPEALLEIHDLSRTPGPNDAEGSNSAFEAARNLPEVAMIGMAHEPRPRSWNRPDGLESVQVAEVSDGYLPVCGIQPFLGRGFQAGETWLRKPPALAVVSHRFWKTRLQGRGDVLGSLLPLNGADATIVGVLPQRFEGHQFNRGAEVLVPCQDWPFPATHPVRGWAQVLVRLRSGVTAEQLKARLSILPWADGWHMDVKPYQPMPPILRAKLGRGLAGLHAASLLILTIGVANVLALQTARLHRRRPDLALRAALGASGGSIFRMVLIENLVLAGLAGIAALGLALASGPFLQALQALLPYPPKVHLAFGFWAAGATLGLALLLGAALAGLVHLQVRRMDLGSPLKGAGTRATGTRTRGLLVAGQAALALVLLSASALCLKDLRQQLSIPLGFELKGRYLVQMQPSKVGRKEAELAPLLDPSLTRLKGLPGVTGVALGRGLPMGGLTLMGGRAFSAYYMTGEAGTLALLGVRPLQGRALEAGDEDRRRIVVSLRYAEVKWPGESPLGKRNEMRDGDQEVVGVVPDLRLAGPTGAERPFSFVPMHRQSALTEQPHATILVRAEGAPRTVKTALKAALGTILNGVPFTVECLEDLRDEQLAQPRQLLLLSAVMGALALILSLCGLYGLAAHLAEARKRELGIRVVLGAGPGRILAVLAKGSLLPLVPGLAAGAGLSIAASRLLVSQSAGFAGIDGAVLVWSCLALSLAAALACLLPALRAARIQPMAALRSE